MKSYNQIAGQKTQRIEAVSDGVFAIALTLLVFNIKVPVNIEIASEEALAGLFLKLVPQLLSYFLSFMTLGIYWTAHSTQFHYIVKSDRHLNWINLFFLLFVSTIPFTTAFLSQFISFKFAVGIYWLNIILLGLLLALHWFYARKRGFLSLSAEESESVTQIIKRRIIQAQSLYTFGAMLCFISTYLSIVVLTLIQLNYALVLFSHRARRQERVT